MSIKYLYEERVALAARQGGSALIEALISLLLVSLFTTSSYALIKSSAFRTDIVTNLKNWEQRISNDEFDKCEEKPPFTLCFLVNKAALLKVSQVDEQ